MSSSHASEMKRHRARGLSQLPTTTSFQMPATRAARRCIGCAVRHRRKSQSATFGSRDPVEYDRSTILSCTVRPRGLTERRRVQGNIGSSATESKKNTAHPKSTPCCAFVDSLCAESGFCSYRCLTTKWEPILCIYNIPPCSCPLSSIF